MMKRNFLDLRVSLSAGNFGGSVPNILTHCPTPTSTPDSDLFSNQMKVRILPRPRSASCLANYSVSPSPSTKSASYSSLSPSKGLDRFIPSRSANNFDISGHNLSGESSASKNAKKASQMRQKSPMTEDVMKFKKVLHFSSPKKEATRVSPSKKSTKLRRLPTSAENILDAPGIINNFFSNAIDWNKGKLLAAALDNRIFLWKSSTSETNELFECKLPSNEVSSVKWNQDGTRLVAGMRNGDLHLWDSDFKYQGVIAKHGEYVTALSWNKNCISSGDALGYIFHTNILDKSVVKLKATEDIVCGMKWSPSGKFLLVGSSNGEVQLYQGFKEKIMSVDNLHTAAAKAMAWCPWNNRVFATGGGLKDQKLRLWQLEKTINLTINDITTHSEDTGSQVCDLVWPTYRKEIITCHAHPDYRISFWSYPSLSLIGYIHGHMDRVLSLTLSPLEDFLVSASADETIRLWNCFPESDDKENKQKSPLNKISIR